MSLSISAYAARFAGRLFIGTSFACAAAVVAPAFAQSIDRPVRLVVGSTVGGGVDRTARLLAAKLGDELRQPVIVENRDGAGTRLASDAVAKSSPDGRTLLFVTGESTIDLAFDPAAKPNVLVDLVPVSQIAECQMLLVVRTASPDRNVGELVARARANPGKLNYSTAGVKTTMHLVGELFKERTAANIVHVPYKGTVPALRALIAGDVDLAFAALPSAQPFIEAGALRALAVAGHARSPLMPDVPTLAEAGVKGVAANIWYGVLAPNGTSPDTIDALARALQNASAAPDYRRSLESMGLEPAAGMPSRFGELLRNDVATYRAVIQVSGMRAE
jgi:tripartite-type tricarboxylate transporter receptor subunit TctC